MFQEVFLCYINAFNSIQWYSNLIHRLHLSGKVPTPFSGVCIVVLWWMLSRTKEEQPWLAWRQYQMDGDKRFWQNQRIMPNLKPNHIIKNFLSDLLNILSDSKFKSILFLRTGHYDSLIWFDFPWIPKTKFLLQI